jgi:hypothetical protein
MNILLIILGSSFIVLLGMILYRNHELKTGKDLIPEKIRNTGSKKILDLALFFKKNFIEMKIKTVKFVKELPDKTHLFLHDIWIKTYPKIDAYFHRLKGRKHFFRKDD